MDEEKIDEKRIDEGEIGKGKIDKKKLRLLFMGVLIIAVLIAAVTLVLPRITSSESSPEPEAAPTPGGTGTTQPSTHTPDPNRPKGQIESVILGKDKYNAGDTVNAEMKVKNTGEVDMTSEKIIITVKCVKLESFGGNMVLKGLSDEEKTEIYTLSFSGVISPGESKTLSAKFDTPEEMSGVSLAGEYDLTLTLKVDGYSLDQEKMNLVLY